MNFCSVKVRLIANPIAGGGALRSIEKAQKLLKDKVTLSTFITQKKGDATRFAKESVEAIHRGTKTDLIIVAGGDGTFNEVINGVLSSEGYAQKGKDIPLALLPVGITNVLAKELGIPERIEKAVNAALTGTPRKVSLGRIVITRRSSLVTRHFCLMAGIGFDGEAVFRLNENIKRISGKGAHIISGVNSLIKYNPPLIEIKVPEGVATGYTAVVSKASCYGGYFKVTPRASLTEPTLDLCLFKGSTRMDLLRFVFGVIMKRHLNFKDVFYGKFSELEISSKGNVHVQIDGDYFGTLPVKIDVVKDAVSIVW
ncbi:MAG: diacylglycerol kinase family lipid kinase [Nitrospirae bacterium]|nr:diacylglycerol kinase family lipid kinase [Nitrospirota bacterium]